MLPNDKRVLWALALIALFFFLLSQAADASPAPCTGLADLLARLEARYGEHMLWQGTGADGQSRLLVTAQPAGGTWTAMVQHPDGRVCLLATGESWQAGAAPAPMGEEG